jgi:hypothetical protein
MGNRSNLLFYKGYLVEKHLITAQVLFNSLENLRSVKSSKKVNYIDNQEEKIYQVQIRSTFLLLIDNLFELLFVLKPKDGIVQDDFIVKNVLKIHLPTFNKFVRDFSKNHAEWFNECDFGLPIMHLLFFENKENNVLLLKNAQNVLEILCCCSKIISDRSELNAVKHGGRIFPLIKSMNVKSDSENKTYSNEESVSYFAPSDDPDYYTLKVNGFNCEKMLIGIKILTDITRMILLPRRLKYEFLMKQKKTVIIDVKYPCFSNELTENFVKEFTPTYRDTRKDLENLTINLG